MTRTILTTVALAFVLGTSGVAAADCRSNCIKIFAICKQGCIDNYSGIEKRACKIGCRKGKRASIRSCRQYPQVCPPIE